MNLRSLLDWFHNKVAPVIEPDAFQARLALYDAMIAHAKERGCTACAERIERERKGYMREYMVRNVL